MTTGKRITHVLKIAVAPPSLAVALFAGIAANTTPVQADPITDFSSFSETGNLLNNPSHTREQSFTPSGTTVTIASVSGVGAGQEAYLSDAFPTLTDGDRMSVDLNGGTFNGGSTEKYGLAIASAEGITSRVDLVTWSWRPNCWPESVVQLDSFDGSGAGAPAQTTVTSAPDTLFIERTATGWTFGSIKDGTETKHFENITQVGGDNITADGSAIGLWSDMRADTSTWSVSNLDVPIPATPATPGTLIYGK